MGSLSQIPMQRYYFFAKITDTILAFIDTKESMCTFCAVISKKETPCLLWRQGVEKCSQNYSTRHTSVNTPRVICLAVRMLGLA